MKVVGGSAKRTRPATIFIGLGMLTICLPACQVIEDVGKGVGDVLTGAAQEVSEVGKDVVGFPFEVGKYDKERTNVARLIAEKQQLDQAIEDKEHPPPDPRTTLPTINSQAAW